MSMTNTPTGGSNASTSTTPAAAPSPCAQQGGASSLERSRYFARQLLTADDLTADQQHVLSKLRRHNRYLHGWGVVCGAGVRAVSTQNWTVVVEPGYILGPQGDEILIDTCVQVDLSQQGLDGNAASPCVPPVDPWCASTRVDLRIGQQLFIAVAYAECLSRPVRIQPTGCGCEDAGCEYSRIRDGYVIRVLNSLPDSYANLYAQPPVNPRLCPPGGVRACPACISDPWVLLAGVIISGSQIRDSDIDNITYRRHVISFADDYLICGPRLLSLVLNPNEVVAGNPSTGTVTLDRPAPQGDSYIMLENFGPTSATAPDHVIVPATHSSMSFPIETTSAGPGGDVTFTATLLGDKKSAVLSILTFHLDISPDSGQVGGKFIGTVTLSTTAPGDTSIAIVSDNTAIASAPSPVTIAKGSKSQTFDISTSSPGGLVTFTASLGAIQRKAKLSVYSLTGLSVGDNNRKALAGQPTQGTVTLSGPVPAGGVTVDITSITTDVAKSTSTQVTVNPNPAGNSTGTFTVQTFKGGTAGFTATLGTQSQSANLEVVGLKAFSASRVFLSTPRSTGGVQNDDDKSNGTVILSDTAPVDAEILLSSTPAKQPFLTVPPSVTIPAGQSSSQFPMKAVGTNQTGPSVSVTATLANDSQSQEFHIAQSIN